MPGAAAAAVVGFFSLTGGAATLVYGAVYLVVTGALNFGLSRIAQSLSGKPKRETVGAARDVTVRGTVEPMQLIYGEVVTPGFIANYATSSANNRYLHFVIAVAAHQCEDISDVWLDSREVPDADIDGSGDVSTAEFQGEGASRLNIKRYLGTSAQTADSELSGAAIGNWSSDHRGAGVAWAHIRLDGSDAAFPSGAPSNFRFKVKGRRLYDPSKDSTNGGSGSHRYANATTWEWSQNAALAIRDYISGGSRWYDTATPEPRLGFAESNSRIDDAYTIAARSICNENVAIPPSGSPSTFQKRYTCDVQISCGDTHKENLDILKSACVGNVTYVNGKYRIYAGAYDSPAVDLGEDDILGSVTVSTHPNGEELYNFVRGTFFDEANDWQLKPFPSITNSSYETDDGGQFKRDIELHATRTSYRCQRIAILHLAQSRNKITVRFERLSPKAMAIAQHETFTVTISEYGWSSKVFRCLEWEFMPDGFISITAREESSAAYADPSVGTYVPAGSGTVATPEYDLPDTPINFEARSVRDGILFRWEMPSPENPATTFRLYEHTADSPFSSATLIESPGTAKTITIERPGNDTKYYWLTAVLNGVESEETPSGDGLPAAPFVPGLEELFFDSFEHQDYERFYNLRTGTPTVTYPTNGENGGRVIRMQNYGWIASRFNIPYDHNALYFMSVRVRMTTAPTGGLSAEDLIFAGVEGVAADGATLINTSGSNSSGSQHYFAASGLDMGAITLGDWVTTSGYLSGLGTPDGAQHSDITDPEVMYASGGTVVKFIRPLVILNYNGGNGTMEVDYIRIEKVVTTQRIGPNATTGPIAQTSASGATTIPSPVSPPIVVDHDLLSLSFTPDVAGEVKITGDCSVEVTGHGGALGRCWLQLVLDGSVEYEKRITTPVTNLNDATTHMASVKADVTATSHTAILRIQSRGSGTDPGQALSVTNKVLRVEVNLR